MEKKFCKVLKALGEPTRMKIVKLLSVRSMCVCQLTVVLDMIQPRVSQHLRVLKEAELIEENRKGSYVFHRLNRNYLDSFWEEFTDFLDADLSKLDSFRMEHRRLTTLGDPENILKNK